ncbi:MAG TPA: YCF48-related protein [Solimonas sp.]|nr:YCF48-related protein [Solimonas sp.]
MNSDPRIVLAGRSKARASSRRLGLFTGMAVLSISLCLAQDSVPSSGPQVLEAAEKSPKAARGLLLDVASTGERLVAVGERGNIVASRDGRRWAQVEVPVRVTLTAVTFASPTQGWAVGHDVTILHTSDGGRSWDLQHQDVARQQPLLDVLFLDELQGFAAGAFGMLFATIDGGQTWNEVDAPVLKEDNFHLHSLTRLRNGSLLIAGERGLLAWSADGVHWAKLASPYEGSFFGAVSRGDAGVIVFGLRGNTFVADDTRAPQWRKLEVQSTRTLFAGSTLEDGSTVLVGADGAVVLVRPDDLVEDKSMKARAAERVGGTLSAIVPWQGQLVTVGELGIQPYAVQ